MSALRSNSLEEEFSLFIRHLIEKKSFPKKAALILQEAFSDYYQATRGFCEENTVFNRFRHLAFLVKEYLRSPKTFSPFHKKITAPYNYEQFGKDFVEDLMDKKKSTLLGKNHLNAIDKLLRRKKNVILFSNHQTELDPQIIQVLLEKEYPFIAENMVFVAGERVLKDPLAVPFSLGCSMFCIYSRKYIDIPKAEKETKQAHNKKTMHLMSGSLAKGGLCIFVAPSGGRDRRSIEGKITISPFDEKSISMFCLMAKKAELSTKKVTTHFYPLSLDTYGIAPPPKKTELPIGEKRLLRRATVGLCFGEEIAMQSGSNENRTKEEKRKKICAMVYGNVVAGYKKLVHKEPI